METLNIQIEKAEKKLLELTNQAEAKHKQIDQFDSEFNNLKGEVQTLKQVNQKLQKDLESATKQKN